MIIWDTETPTKIGQYLVLSKDNYFDRVDIEYWDGAGWSDMDIRNIPIKWSYINKEE